MSEFHDHLSSPTNPNGLFSAITRADGDFELLPLNERLMSAVADSYTFALGVLELNPAAAETLTLRAITETARAMAPDMSTEEIQGVISNGIAFAQAEMAERAAHMFAD